MQSTSIIGDLPPGSRLLPAPGELRVKHVGADPYTLRAAIPHWQPAPDGCWLVARGKQAGADDLSIVRASSVQPAPASCLVLRIECK